MPESPFKRSSVLLLMDHYYPEIHEGVLRAARDFGWDLHDNTCLGFHHHLVPDWEPDAVLATTETDKISEWFRTTPLPKVRILADASPSTVNQGPDDITTVALGFSKAGRMAANHLLSLKTPHVAYYKYCQARDEQSTFDAFMAACREEGKEPIVLDYPGTFREPDQIFGAPGNARRRWLRDEIRKLPFPCALMCDDDRFATEAILCAQDVGLTVPEDLAVLGLEDRKLLQLRAPVTISSIDMNLEHVGYLSASLLQQKLTGESLPQSRYLVEPRRLMERQSTATFYCEIPGVTKAILAVRRDFARPLKLAELARDCGMSVRNLQRLYPLHTGRTIREDLMACRIEAASDLLIDSDLKLDGIAVECGLGNAKNLCRIFKDEFGVTPTAWRESRGTLLRQRKDEELPV